MPVRNPADVAVLDPDLPGQTSNGAFTGGVQIAAQLAHNQNSAHRAHASSSRKCPQGYRQWRAS